MPLPNFNLGESDFWNGLLVNAITFLLPLSLAIATFGVNKWREKRQKRARHIELICLIKHELDINQKWVREVRGALPNYLKWVDSAIEDRKHSLPNASLSVVSSKPHSAVWESVRIEFASIDQSKPRITEPIVLSYSSYAEAVKQVDFINQLIISAVLARAARGQAVDVSSARLAYKMIRGLIDPLTKKLAEAEKQGEEVVAKLRTSR